jgi:proline dehydrogenase
MEDSSTVDKTITFHKTLRNEGYTNLGLVIQAYLYRSEKDLLSLMELFTPIRLCKGAYKEPSSVAFPRKADVDKNYDKLAEILLKTSINDNNPYRSEIKGIYPPLAAIATHDEKRIRHIKEYAEKHQIGNNYFEFQMLYGIRRDLQENLVKEGYAVRVYVPFGSQWYPYFMRRLAERPANLWFMMTNLLR